MPAASASRQMLSAFELFPRLPSEIRHEIWKLSFPLFASFVQIRITECIPPYRHRQRQPWKRIWAAKRDVPPFLHCCHESRALALAYYKLGFQVKSHWSGPGYRTVCRLLTVCQHDKGIARLNRQLYWDPKEDFVKVVELGEDGYKKCSPGARCRSHEARCVATLDQDARMIEVSEELWDSCSHKIADGFPGLEQVRIVVKSDNELLIDRYIPDESHSAADWETRREIYFTEWKDAVQESLLPKVVKAQICVVDPGDGSVVCMFE
jgi:2EXR family